MHLTRFVPRRKRTVLVALAVLALVFAGIGYAVWSMTQQTSVLEGQSGNTVTLGIIAPTTADLSAAQQCFPGGSCPLIGEVSNPSGTPITLTSYQASTANGFADPTDLNCTSFTGPAQATATVPISPGIVIPAGAVHQVVTLPNALALPANAPTGCQNVTIIEGNGHITLTFTAGS